jgi:hypothetical protein
MVATPTPGRKARRAPGERREPFVLGLISLGARLNSGVSQGTTVHALGLSENYPEHGASKTKSRMKQSVMKDQLITALEALRISRAELRTHGARRVKMGHGQFSASKKSYLTTG